jgi:cell division protein FtsI (penicillin-binding protein 3)
VRRVDAAAIDEVPTTTPTIASDTERLHRPIRIWSRVLVIGISAVLVATLARVAQLQARPGEALEAHLDPRTSTAARPAQRGRLLDRRGQVVALSIAGRRLYADPAFIYERAYETLRRRGDHLAAVRIDPFGEVAAAIADAIGGDPNELARVLGERADRRYVVLAPELEPWQAEAIAALRLPGIGLEPILQRVYPFETLAASIVGRVGWTGEGPNAREHAGQAGLEARLEQRLRHQDGRVTFRRDARGRVLHVAPGHYRPPRDGADVRLTIDMVVQEIAERHLAEAVARSNAGGGRLVVLDLADGGVLAMADLLQSRPGRSREDPDDPLRRLDPALARNRGVTDPFEPGSTFKPFIWATALDLGVVRVDEVIPTPAAGPLRLSHGRNSRSIRDVRYHGSASWRTVLVRSLNTGMAIVSQRMTPAQMQAAVRAFGFGSPTESGLAGESAGLVTSPRDWKMLYTQVSVSFGQEIGVTALQMVRAFAALCGDGTLPTIRLTMPDEGEEGPIAAAPRRAVSAAAARVSREVMEAVMLEGTGRRARSEHYRIFGKSGTAQLPRREGGGYHEDRYRSSFVGAAPFETPRLVVLCIIDDPDRTAVPDAYGGGALAGPVVRNVLDEALAYLGVEPDQPPRR